ncbi:MAG: PIN domain-containing protein [bacterium]
MNGPEVPDTSVFIAAIRGDDALERITRAVRSGRGYLSSVVAQELWAGTRSRDDADALSAVMLVFERIGLTLVPSYDDWVLAGRLLRQYARLYGAIEPRDHVLDVLIVLTASQVDGTVVTANARHMDRWARMARRSGRQVWVRAV